MIPFALYLIAAVVTAFAVLSDLQYAVWGAPVLLGHLAGADGVLILVAASVVSLFRPRVAAALGLIAAAAIGVYILPMLQLVDPRFVAPPSALRLSVLVGVIALYAIAAILGSGAIAGSSSIRNLFPESVGRQNRLFALPIAFLICGLCAVAFLVLPGRRDVWSTALPSDLIVYFTESASDEEIIEFNVTVVGIPIPEGGSGAHSLLPEISGVTRVSEVAGHQGYAIGLWPNVSDLAKQEVIDRIWTSPIVYAVLEDVAPADVTTLPAPGP